MPNPFDWDYLTTPPASDDVLDAFTILYLALFLVGFVVSAYVYYRPWTKPFGTMFRRTAVVKATGVAMWVFGIGLFFFLIRLLQINPLTFGEPFWMWLSVLAVIVMIVWAGLSWNQGKKAVGHAPSQRTRQAAPQSRPVRRKTTLR
jgi:hypothetical protein